MSESPHGMWSSRLMFILAAAGSAVGLGNIWRFPYVAGENGGGAFVIAYLACIFMVGVPIMIAEIALGRAGRKSPINTMQDLTAQSGAWGGWQVIGWFAGWFLDQKILTEQLEGTSEIVIKMLRVLMRIIAPVCISVVFVMTFVS
jgi:SNF family Na+-dependent transporter